MRYDENKTRSFGRKEYLEVPFIALLAAMSILLSGCRYIVRDDYYSASDHAMPSEETDEALDTRSVQNYEELKNAVLDFILEGAKEAVITADDSTYIGHFNEDYQAVLSWAAQENPDSVYLLNEIEDSVVGLAPYYQLRLSFHYQHTKAELDEAITVGNVQDIETAICGALDRCDERLLLRVHSGATLDGDWYQALKLNSIAQRYFEANMTIVMSQPNVVGKRYPETGKEPLLELQFQYPNLDDALDLKTMQSSVNDIMEAAKTYVKDYKTEQEKAMLLYSFLAARLVEFESEASAAPAYDMLISGKADSRTLSAVYKAMCNQSGVSCIQVHGTKNDKDYYWNILELSSGAWHVDLLSDIQNEYRMQLLTDGKMYGYNWDSHYPSCPGAYEVPESKTTQPSADTNEKDRASQAEPVEDEPITSGEEIVGEMNSSP